MQNIQPRWMRIPRPRYGACCAKHGFMPGRRNTSSRCTRGDMDAPLKLQSLADFLSSVKILSPFTGDELERLAEQAESRFYAFGDTVCSAGEPADGLFVIKSGSVRIFTEEHGKEISMGVRKEREVFADIAMLRDYWHEYSVRASVKTELLFITRKAIEPIISRNPAAQAFITSYVAISSAGGLVASLCD